MPKLSRAATAPRSCNGPNAGATDQQRTLVKVNN